MRSTFYLPRRLWVNDTTYTEEALLSESNYVVILAEPGGGKTELMSSLAQRLCASVVTANVFRQVGPNSKNCPLIIDAFDELAKVDRTGIDKLLAHAHAANPTHVVISSRSSEWDSSATSSFNDFLGHWPLVVRLYEFDKTEQRALFNHHAQGEDFEKFQSEVGKFGLEALLPNPQFLQLFADAYIESNRTFIDKRSIFFLAVERLAKEANSTVKRTTPTLSISQKVELSSEVFAKLLLSGAEGVGTNEAAEDRMYPLLASLFSETAAPEGILATRLFRPGDDANQHRPVHKIVTEYCAAGYLTRRIADPTDPLTLGKCMPLIAPNSIVRDELRGLLGWMASLGNKSIQNAAIKLDPYAVLANGDPSQLEHSSKHYLIQRLREVEVQDPYFRRGDFWRRFSVAGFFTQDVVDAIKPILAVGGPGHLRDLVLELLIGSPAISKLSVELRELAFMPNASENSRILASRCLFHTAGQDHWADLDTLISEKSGASLKIAADAIDTIGPHTLETTHLVKFFQACASLYPAAYEDSGSTLSARYFVKRLITRLDLSTTETLLDRLTNDLRPKYGNALREGRPAGTNKIIGSLLDRYFELKAPPFSPEIIWRWVGNLSFQEGKGEDQSKAIKVLQEDNDLRQGIIAHVFAHLTDREQIHNLKVYGFDWHSHAGLQFRTDDYRYLVDLAFSLDNYDLWAYFIARPAHRHADDKKTQASLRRHMRAQASEKLGFLREWARFNRAIAQSEREHTFSVSRRIRRMRYRFRQQANIRAANIQYVQANRELVEGGRHWTCLARFAHLVLMNPDRIEVEFGEEALVRTALRNCLDFISCNVPDLKELAELQCASKGLQVETILYAACLQIFLFTGSLEGVDTRLLRALRTNIRMGYDAVSEEHRNALQAEVDRVIFPNYDCAEAFLVEYVEAQMQRPKCTHPEIWLLRDDEAFSHSRPALAIDWLRRFPGLAPTSLSILFDIAAQYSDRESLKEIISERCEQYVSDWPNPTGSDHFEQKRTFWFVRAWYFFSAPPQACWNWMKEDKNTIFILHEFSGRMNRSEHMYWPQLTSQKVESILDAFIDAWPKVDLPNQWGTDSPQEEIAYRFLTETIWLIDADTPKNSIPVLDRLLTDRRMADLHGDLKSIRASQVRKIALMDFEPPPPNEIVHQLDCDTVVTVESLRQLVLEELLNFQRAIDGGEFNPVDRFYEKGERLGEIRSTEIIAERLSLRLEPQGISITPEHQLKNAKRSDFTVTKMIRKKRRLLVGEVKGQWHEELYTAASAQLSERYSIHPDAEHQGIFLAIWFGQDEKVAGLQRHGITSAPELKVSIEEKMPPDIRGLIDVFVLDVSRPI